VSAPANAPSAPKAVKAPNPTPPLIVKLAITAMAGLFLLLFIIVLLVIGYGKGFSTGTGLFGTRASLFADINLLAELLLLFGLTVGFGLALTHHVSMHQYNQTFWVIFNILLVVFIMLVSFSRQVVRGIPGSLLKAYYATSFIHASLGTITVLFAIYILLRMNRLLPKALRISWWKGLMRLTLGMYWLVGLFGLATYYVWYIQPRDTAVVDPNATPIPAAAGTVVVPLANYAFNPGVLEIPVGTTVIFRNDDPDPHTITSETGAFDEGQVEEKQEFKFTFTAEGDFPYFCQYHGAKGGVGMAGIVKVGAASSIAAALPTEVTPREPTPQPTAAEPPAEALEPQSVGFGAFFDINSRNDGFELKVAGLPPAVGEYHAWLTGTGEPRDLGALQLDSTGATVLRYAAPDGENLLDKFNGFLVTAEAAASRPAAPSTDVLIASTLPEGVRDPIRQLLVASDDAPENAAYTFGLVYFIEDLVRHAKAVNGAAVLGDTDGLNRHSEHMLALLEGKSGPNYKDVDGNGVIQDPGDGYGIVHYADSIAAQAAAAANAPDVTGNVRTHVAEIQVLAVNLRAVASQVIDLVLQLPGASTVERQALASQALVLSRTMLDGKDANGNGAIEPLAREGGAYTTYAYAQYLAALGAVPEAGSGIATVIPATNTLEPTATPEPGSTPVPTAVPTELPQATNTAAAATPTPVFITYRNFEILPGTTTIKVGTTVTFLIEGSLHQPYAGSSEPFIFESPNDLGPGTSWPHTFNRAQTLTILCSYHQNMSATLIIEP
jgi:plastocyanin